MINLFARITKKPLWLVLIICAAPTVAAYLVYYFFPPTTRNNYGDLIQPQRPIPALMAHDLSGNAMPLTELKGKWLMLMVAGSDCPSACVQRLYQLRQVRLTAGKERERVERVWLLSDSGAVSPLILNAYEGTRLLRIDPQQLQNWLPITQSTKISDHIYLIDPRGNLMLCWPADADATRMKKDLSRVLRASRIG